MSIQLNLFTGEKPNTDVANLPVGYASKAVNLNLHHNTLKSVRDDLLIKELSHNHDYCEIQQGIIIEHKKAIFTCALRHYQDLMFNTGMFDYPAVSDLKLDGKIKWGRLGVPAPKSPPNVFAIQPLHTKTTLDINVSNNLREKLDPRCYAFTYVNWLGHEGAMSPPSKIVNVEDGESVTLHNFKFPKHYYRIKSIKVYRTTATSITTNDISSKAVWLYCGEIKTDWKAHFVDNLKMIELGKPYLAEHNDMPPDNLVQLCCVNDTTLVGFYNNYYLRKSEPYNPSAFPLKYEIKSPHPILRIMPLDNDVIVFTTQGNYKLNDITSASEQHALVPYRERWKLVNHDIIGSCIHTDIGILWVSQDGLVLTTGGSQLMLTGNFFSMYDWQKLKPDTMRLGYHHGIVYITSNVCTYMMGIGSSGLVNSKNETYLTKLDISPDYYLTSTSEAAYYVKDRKIYQIQGSPNAKPYTWLSKLFVFKSTINFAVMQYNISQEQGHIEVFLLDDSFKLLYNVVLSKSGLCNIRLKGGISYSKLYVLVHGNKELYSLTLSTSYREL